MTAEHAKLIADLTKLRDENAEIQAALLSEFYNLSVKSDAFPMIRDFTALQSKVRNLEEELELQKVKNQKVCDELEALKKDHGVKLQDHEKMLSVRKIMSIQEQLVGKWKMVTTVGRSEYERLMSISSASTRAPTTVRHQFRTFELNGNTLRVHVDDHRDTSVKIPDQLKGRVIVYTTDAPSCGGKKRQMVVSFQIKDGQLIVDTQLYENSKNIAACQCVYDRVE